MKIKGNLELTKDTAINDDIVCENITGRYDLTVKGNLDCWNFNGNNFNGNNFIGLDFDGWNFNGNNFIGRDFDGLDFNGNNFIGWNFNGNNFNGLDFDGWNFIGNNFIGRDFDGLDFDGSNFIGRDFDGSNFNGWNIIFKDKFFSKYSIICRSIEGRDEKSKCSVLYGSIIIDGKDYGKEVFFDKNGDLKK